MNKKIFLILVAGFALASCEKSSVIDYKEEGYTMKELDADKVTVTFYKNIGKEELDLNSGRYASGTTTAYKIDVINKNSKVSKPQTDPLRVNYEFNGWHTHATENSPFDFNNDVSSSLFLYAHWTQTQEDDFAEPEYVEPTHIDDTIDTLVSINGVLNMPVVAGSVSVAQASISRLNRDNSNVVDCLNYKVKTGVTLTATFNGTNLISYAATNGTENQNGTISVSKVALDSGNETYDKKAANYEVNDIAFEDHRIMLAGSSSMENWKNSSEDLKPLTTYNHGIGGTTVEMWRDKYNQRLVYPYSPKIIVYYVGVNNMKDGANTGVETGTWLNEMFDDVHAHLPNTHIYYVLINELPGFRNRQDQFDICNDMAMEYEQNHDYVTCIDAGKGLLKDNGEPNQAFFLFDGIHMSLAGYAIWGKVIKDKLIADFKNNA